MGKNSFLDGKTALPRYKQVADGIKTYIRRNGIPPGGKLPGGRFFANVFGAGKNTVYEALELLQNERVVEIKKDSGSYVAGEPWMDFIKNSPGKKRSCRGFAGGRSAGAVFRDLFVSVGDSSNIYLTLASLHNSFGYGAAARQALAEIGEEAENSDILSVYDVQGKPSFRRVIAERLESRGISVSPSGIVVTLGIEGAADLLVKALLKPGDTVYTESPSIISPTILSSFSGINVVNIAMDEEGLSVTDFRRRFRPGNRCALMLTPFSHAPTGINMSEKRKKELMAFCRWADIPVIEMDPLGDLDSGRPLKADDEDNRVIYLSSIVLPYSLGINIGWIVAPNYLVDRLTAFSAISCYYPFNLNNLLVEKMFSSGSYDSFISGLKVKIDDRIALTNKCLRRYMSGIASWEEKDDRMSFWIKLKNNANVTEMINSPGCGVTVVPGELFGRGYSSYMYIFPYALSEIDLETGISRLSALARSYA